VPLHARRAVLKQVIEAHGAERIRYSDDFSGDAEDILKSACAMKLEGVIAKRRDTPYVSARTDTWLKLKCSERQEFVVIGFRDRAGSKREVGSLLLAYHDEDGKLRYGGSVGTGWSSAAGVELRQRLDKIEVGTPAVDPQTVKPGRWSRSKPGDEHWVKPEVVAEVRFTEWTPDGHVRHPVFVGLRSDKPAKEIRRENPARLGEP
jgi:bifunctional non-homologous end joining protein LigD